MGYKSDGEAGGFKVSVKAMSVPSPTASTEMCCSKMEFTTVAVASEIASHVHLKSSLYWCHWVQVSVNSLVT